MVSDFVDNFNGFLGFTDEEYVALPAPHRHLPQRARMTLELGVNREGFWRRENVMAQLRTAVKIAELKYSPQFFDLLFVFDNSSNHTAKAPDALVASRMNNGPAGAQPIMRDTVWNGHRFRMVDDNGVPKGLAAVIYFIYGSKYIL